jgi:subtilisin family serine protease
LGLVRVAAAAKNDALTQGVAFNATIISMRTDSPGSCASEDGCSFFEGDMAQGIDAARVAGARVINMSLGGSAPNSGLLAAMGRAVDAGIILVISAGNSGEDPEGVNADPLALIPAQKFPNHVIIAGSVGVSDGAGGTNLDVISTFSNRAGAGAQN